VIEQALNTLDIDWLIVVPAFLNPFKSSVVASGEMRLKWMQKVTKSYKNVIVSDFEIKRGKPTPSIVTVKHFAKKYDKIYFIIGSDNVASLQKWSNFTQLDSMVEWVVATRKGYDSHSYKTLDVNVEVSSSRLRENIDKKYIPEGIYEEIKEIYG
jgi:nicotinate-nucleotide adenylyltransferase